MNMQIESDKFLDNRNIKLWETLNEFYAIDIQSADNLEYSCYTINNKATIYVVLQNICKDSFTHELLHIYLKYKKIFIGAGLKNKIQSSNVLKRIFSELLIEHFGNCLDHIKMFDIYSKMGFDPQKFILDYSTFKCTASELKDLKKYYKQNGPYNTQAVDLYVGKFVAMCADFNEDFNYEKCFEELEKLDQSLYSILDKFMSKWDDFDIENHDVVHSSYHTLLHDFYEDLKRWVTNKKFI